MTICFPRSLTLPQVVHFVCTGLPSSFILSWQFLFGERLHFTCTSEFNELSIFKEPHIYPNISQEKEDGTCPTVFSSSCLFVGLHFLEQKNRAQLWTLNAKRQPSWRIEHRKGKYSYFYACPSSLVGFGSAHPHSRTVVQRILHTEEIIKYKNKHS